MVLSCAVISSGTSLPHYCNVAQLDILFIATMASTRVFEDQENVLPGNQNRAKPQDPRLVLGSRRPVLGAINPNLRKQPVRAAKQVSN